MDETGFIREATAQDLKEIIDLENRCFNQDHAYSAKQLTYLITKAHSYTLVYVNKEKIHGFLILLFRKGSVVSGVETINVDPVVQKKGIGKKLMLAAEQEARKQGMREIRLEVSIGNAAAILLYEKLGYVITALLTSYYQTDHFGSKDAYRMKKKL